MTHIFRLRPPIWVTLAAGLLIFGGMGAFSTATSLATASRQTVVRSPSPEPSSAAAAAERRAPTAKSVAARGAADAVPLGEPKSCVNSDGSPCPDSYFSGPLGRNNIVPGTKGALLIDQYGGYGVGWAETQDGIRDRQNEVGRTFDGIQVQANKDPRLGNERKEQWILDQGAGFVVIAWNPTYDIAAINAGKEDQTFADAARYWADYKPNRIMIRVFTEFNLRSEVLNGSCGQPFRTAWQRMVTIFEANGATNVGFWYNPDEGNHRQCVADSYPGDAYVDWVGSDSYNWCSAGDRGCYATPLHPGPAMFGELFDYGGGMKCGSSTCPRSTYDRFGARKPFVVGETGSISDGDAATKARFLRSIAIDAKKMKYLRGISLFDFDVSPVEGPRTDFRLDQPTNSTEVSTAMKQLGSDPWFRTRI